ncbi:beta-N-acetylhexosaminidase [Streptomyces sulfonofaciens]|nr:beta-N-acetylhexosaminidase [Streptomyces sulfonofaciens]
MVEARARHRLGTSRLLGSLLLVAAAGLCTVGVLPASAQPGPGTRAATPLDSIVPAPASVTPGGTGYEITEGTGIRVHTDTGKHHKTKGHKGRGGHKGHADGDADAAREVERIADYLAGVLRPSTGFPLPVTGAAGDDGIRLELVPGETGLGTEGYRLASDAHAVTITAAAPGGLFHGVQTLRQLLPAAVEESTVQPGPWRIAGGTLEDSPRFAYRGAMLDVSRHFFSVDQVKRFIDELALYKINELHLHLSDDQGWRIAVDSWPRLATYGGSTEVGGGKGGYYTKAQYTDLVAYAASRYVEVVPEIDMPGHTNAALASYAELNCDGVAPPLYTGTEVGFSSLCAPKQVTYDFLSDVLSELAALTPGRYLHIGGDEAHSTSHDDYVSLMDRAQPMVTAHGKTVLAWHQLTGAHPVPGAVAQYWGYDATGAQERQQVVDAARNGTRIVLSPADRAYLDMKYTQDTPLGQDWAGLVEVRRSYDWDPGTYLAGVPEDAVLGVEAPLWTETITDSADIDYMAFPRLPGIAELGWSPASTHDWEGYRARLAAQGPRMTALGIDFYRSPQVDWPE